jgi:hypothetical protein
MVLREQMVDARAWGPVVRLEQLICDLQGLRGGRAEPADTQGGGSEITVPALSAESLRDRAPLLVQACARIAAASEDNDLVEQTRDALSRGLSLLNAASPLLSEEIT